MTTARLPLLVLSPLLVTVLLFSGSSHAQAEGAEDTPAAAAEESQDEAVTEARAVSEADREKARDLVARGKALITDKKAKEALTLFEEAIELAPGLAAAWWEMGWAYWVLEDYAKCVELWEKVLELEPDHKEAPEWIRQTLETQRMRAAAKARQESGSAGHVPAPPEEVGSARLLLAAVGDTMMGDGGGYLRAGLPPNEGRDLFTDIAPIVQKADIGFVNLEGPFADGGRQSKCRSDSKACYAFRQPSSLAPRLKEAGFDLVSIANNHANDYGSAGRESTIRVLDELGLYHSGPIGDLASFESKGLKIGFVAMATSPNLYRITRLDEAAVVVSELAASHDIVIVSFHGGAEGDRALHVPEGTERAFGENRGNLRLFSRTVIDAGADLVLGHGPHVPRGLELYKNRLIAYSLGNFATYGFRVTGNKGLGPILLAYLDEHGAFVEGEIVSTRQANRAGPLLDEARECVSLMKELTEADFPETGPVVTTEGKILPRE
ncbi:MAG: CapA family protein [Myxococcota bacterium]|nr:CapA family protein [Myxococcota bacterium]